MDTDEHQSHEQSPFLGETIKRMEERLTALENREAPKVNPADIHAALEDHPLVTEFRAFADKWRNK